MKRKSSPIWKIETKVLKDITKRSLTYSDLLRHFKLSTRGSNIRTLKERIEFDNIDTSHFDAYKARATFLKNNAEKKIVPWDKVLVANSSYKLTGRRKARLINEGLLKNECAISGCPDPSPVWNNKPLVLILDHINGNSSDHRLNNLRLVCPNCNSQLETHCGKNKTKPAEIYRCKRCFTQVKTKDAEHCRSCDKTLRYQIAWPDIDLLISKVDSSSLTAVARELGCSDNAVKKHILKFKPNWKRNASTKKNSKTVTQPSRTNLN